MSENFELEQTETTNPSPAGVVHLDGVALWLAGQPPQNQNVQFSDLARFQPKILFGDPSKDDNDLLSVYEFGNLSGGHGVEILKEGTDTNRYYFGTLHTRFPHVITKPPYIDNTNSSGSGDKRILGEMYSADINDHIVIYMAGTAVRRGLITASGTHVFDTGYANITINTTSLVPVNPGVAFQGVHTEERFFVPCGNDGYFIVEDTGTTIVTSTAHKFSSFVVWDNKLIGITTGGRLYRCTDASGAPPTWTAYDVTWSLSKSYRIRGMVNYFDRRDEPCIYIITDRDLWQFEPDGPELFRIDNGWASHPRHGIAHAVWNGQLHISVGMGVKRYTGGTWMDVGLDRDDGLPPEYQGYIVEMVAGTNALYALVQGTSDVATYGGKSSLHEFNGSSWNCIWQQDTADPTGTNHGTDTTALTVRGLAVTQSGSAQTLLFATAGTDDKVYTMPLTQTTANPRQAIRLGQYFSPGEYFYVELGRFNADMFGYEKIGNALQYLLAEPVSQAGQEAFRDTVRWLYNIDQDGWEELTEHRADPGRYGVPLGPVIDGMPAGYTQGVEFEEITLRYEVWKSSVGTSLDKPTVLEGAVLSFLKTVESNYAFTIAVDISNGSADGRMSADELATWIDALISRRPKRFVSFTVGQDTYRVFISQNLGTKWTGNLQTGTRQLSVLQIPTNKL